MTTIPSLDTTGLRGQKMLNKVPEVTLHFWVIIAPTGAVSEGADA